MGKALKKEVAFSYRVAFEMLQLVLEPGGAAGLAVSSTMAHCRTVRLPLIGKSRSKIGLNSLLKWICFYRLMANA
jgi:hypothetical protein